MGGTRAGGEEIVQKDKFRRAERVEKNSANDGMI